MTYLDIHCTDFMNIVIQMKAKYNNSIVVYKNSADGENTYEAYIDDADFFIKYFGLHRISSNNDFCWVAFPEEMLEIIINKISKIFQLVIVEPLELNNKGFQLSINF